MVSEDELFEKIPVSEDELFEKIRVSEDELFDVVSNGKLMSRFMKL